MLSQLFPRYAGLIAVDLGVAMPRWYAGLISEPSIS